MSLFILTLMDKRPLPAYQKFEKDVRDQAAKYYPNQKIDVNYHTGAFHDSVIMFAVNANMTVSEGLNISKANIIPLTQRFWGVVFEGTKILNKNTTEKYDTNLRMDFISHRWRQWSGLHRSIR